MNIVLMNEERQGKIRIIYEIKRKQKFVHKMTELNRNKQLQGIPIFIRRLESN